MDITRPERKKAHSAAFLLVGQLEADARITADTIICFIYSLRIPSRLSRGSMEKIVERITDKV